MADIPSIEIGSLTPAHQGFALLFELLSIIQKNNQRLLCRIVDESGIVNASFNQYSDKLEEGVVYYMTNLICKVVDHHLQVQMTNSTSVTKEPAKLGFRDKANDISKKFFATRSQIAEITESQNSAHKGIGLIPLSQEQAERQIKQKKLFDEFLKGKKEKHKNKDEKIQNSQKVKEKQIHKQKVEETPKNKKNATFTKDEKEHKQKYIEKGTQKKADNRNDHQKHLKYEEKHIKREYVLKPSTPQKKQKSKSFMYKPKESPVQPKRVQNSQKKTEETSYQRPKFVQKKENIGESMELISVVAHVNGHVNIKAWISSNKRNITENGYDCMVADKTGSLWLRIIKLNLQGCQWYEIDNLEVTREEGRLILKQTQLSESRQLDEAMPFDMKLISGSD